MPQYDYDLLVLGGGSAGQTAAKTARGFGKKVAIIEKNKLGGECTWTGCVPSKALIKIAHVAHSAKQLEKYGLQSSSSFSLDTSNVMNSVHSIINEVYAYETPEVFKKEGIDIIFGDPQFIDNYSVSVNNKTVTAKQFIIATGSSPFVPPIEGLDNVKYLTNETLFNLKELPKSMIILGGGPIGAEMASALNRLGVTVTIIEMQDRILPKEDSELVAMLAQTMQIEGVEIKTGLRAEKVEQTADEISVHCVDSQNNTQMISAQQLLIAVGRKPNIFDLNLKAAGVKTTKRAIEVDKTLRTTTKNIFACGDVVGPYLFSHMAWYQAVIAVRNALIPVFKTNVDYRNVIWVTFTAPELASAGMTEEQAREKYKEITVYKIPYSTIDRAHTDRTTDGLAKYICDKKGYLVGIHILGAQAGDIIHEPQLAKTYGIPLQKIGSVIHAYPTYSELNWHAGKRAYVDQLMQKWYVRFFKRFI